MNVLFVCSRNQWRSPTAEAIYRDAEGINVRSAGTSSSARTKLNSKTIEWADVIFAMEKRHRQIILERFPGILAEKRLYVLDIPDEYQYMDEELIDQIKTIVSPLLEKLK